MKKIYRKNTEIYRIYKENLWEILGKYILKPSFKFPLENVQLRIQRKTLEQTFYLQLPFQIEASILQTANPPLRHLKP